MTLRLVLTIACCGAALTGSAQALPSGQSGTSAASRPSTEVPHARIWVLKSGDLELNGKPAKLEAVAKALEDLAKRKGLVLYGREAADEEPHPNGMKVMELVVRNRLPIRMSTKRDFSDVVGPDGKIK